MIQVCLLHSATLTISCVACLETKPCYAFERCTKKKSGHRHRCLDCVDLGRDPAHLAALKATPPPPPPPTRFTVHEIAACQAKVRFSNRLDALGSCANSVKRGRPLSVYQCPVCGGFHKTSKRLRWAVKPSEATRRPQGVVDGRRDA